MFVVSGESREKDYLRFRSFCRVCVEQEEMSCGKGGLWQIGVLHRRGRGFGLD